MPPITNNTWTNPPTRLEVIGPSTQQTSGTTAGIASTDVEGIGIENQALASAANLSRGHTAQAQAGRVGSIRATLTN